MLAVRWHLRFGLSYRDVEELLAERGVQDDPVTIYRWVQRFTPLLAVATAEEVVGTDHGEAHRVLVAISHSAGGAFWDDEQAGMGSRRTAHRRAG